MTLPRATLVPMGLGVWTAKVDGHPCPDTSIQITRLTVTERKVRLFHGAHLVGEGVLRLGGDDVWRGETSEFAGKWHIEARKGSAEVLFRESAEVGT